jgi:hypothetical protein
MDTHVETDVHVTTKTQRERMPEGDAGRSTGKAKEVRVVDGGRLVVG